MTTAAPAHLGLLPHPTPCPACCAGASKNTNLMEWDKIWATNKAEIDAKAGRYTALLSDGLVPCTLKGAAAEPYAKTQPLHPKDESLGKRVSLFAPTVLLQADDAAGLAPKEEVTLMSWGNIIIDEVVKDAAGKVTALKASLHMEGSVKSTKKKLTWLAQVTATHRT